MTQYRVDREFLKLKESEYFDFIQIVGTNISTKALFATIATKGAAILTKNALYKTAYQAVNEGDYRKKADRNKYRRELNTMARELADDVNDIANGDEVIIVESGFKATFTPDNKVFGLTELMYVKYNPSDGMVTLRCKKATLAVDYQIDVSTDSDTWEDGVDSMPLTTFYIDWKKGVGKFFIRVCPRDKKGKRHIPSNYLPITIY